MKNLFFVSLVGVFLFGCLANVPSKVCPPPDGKQSWICEKSEQAGVTPEQVYGWIFSASAIGAITDVTSIEWLCEFKGKISDWYVEVYPVSYDSVINKVIKEMKLIDDPRKLLLVKNIINQNMALYSSPKLIGEYDDWLLRAGSNRFDREMMCK